MPVHPGNTRPAATVTAPPPTLLWRVGDVIAFSGEATDPEDGSLPPSAMHWDLFLHHCPGGLGDCHPHLVEQHDGVAGGAFVAPDHEGYSSLEFRPRVTDSGGLQGTDSVTVNPVTVTNAYESDPPGLEIVVGGVAGTAPFDRPAIVGSTNSLSAPSPQTLGGTQDCWTSWSDGSPQSHDFAAGDMPETRRATFAVSGAADPCGGLDNDRNGVPDDPPPPGPAGAVTVRRDGVAWSAEPGATAYDIVRGDLGALSATADFSSATEGRLADDLAATSFPCAGEPAPGLGFRFLVRGVNCGGEGSYDSGAPSRSGSRDAGIEASSGSCP